MPLRSKKGKRSVKQRENKMAGRYPSRGYASSVEQITDMTNRVSISRPIVPYWGAISGGLQIGKIIEIRGFIPHSTDVFQINLVAGQDNGPTNRCDRIMHISVRFNGKVVVRNTMSRNQWENEERSGGFPFELGKQFMVMILVENQCFRIAVDGKHHWEFQHRQPFSRATMVHIDGVVKLDEIRYLNTPSILMGLENVTPEPKIAYMLEPVLNPRIPYFYPIHEGLRPGTMIYISARPTAAAQKLTINLQCDTSPYPPPEDIAFHFDIRMFNRSIVRNTRVNNIWGREETHCPFFPFRCGVFFDMIIRVEADRYMVALDGQHFIEYYHRIFPLTKINALNIENDIAVSSIRVAIC